MPRLRLLAVLCFVATVSGLIAADDPSCGDTNDDSGNPMLGVSMRPPPSNVLQENNLTPDQGVYVREVFDGTAARDMGIQVGDVILAVNGQPISRMNDLRRVVSSSNVGDEVDVVVRRQGEDLRMGSRFQQWPDRIPRRELDTAAEERYRNMLERRMNRQQRILDDATRTNDRLAEQIDDLDRDINRELGLDDDAASRPSAAANGVRPSDLSMLPASVLSLPAWRFDFLCEVAGLADAAASTATAANDDTDDAAEVAMLPAVHCRYSFSIDGEAY